MTVMTSPENTRNLTFIFYTIMMNSWLTELAHHEASVGYHKTVIIAGAKQVTIALRCSL